MKKFSTLVAAAVLGSALTIGSFQLINFKDDPAIKIEHLDSTPIVGVGYATTKDGEIVPLDLTKSAEKVVHAVVHIKSTQAVSYARNNQQPRSLPDPFKEFFGPYLRGQGDINPGPKVGSGSGVIINELGYIVTNNHVVEGADDLEVTLNDNRSYKAKIIGTDPTTDIALIKIEESDLPTLKFVNSDDVKVGEWVLAVGNPFNLTSTVTAGIISAKGRSINILNDAKDTNSANTSIESFIQTDAAVNPGNSGGALVNLNGDLIGINSAIASPTGSYSGYSFAVPSNIVSKVVEDLIAYGIVQRGWLGAQIRNINTEFARENDLKVSEGAYVSELVENSGAKEAGVKEGDVITAIDNKNITNTAQLIGYIGSKRPGDKVNIKVNRNGKDIEYPVVLKNSEGTVGLVEKKKEDVLSVLGADLEDIDTNTLKKLDLKGGVRVKRLEQGRITSYTDMKEGFIITKIDGKIVKNKEDVKKLLSNKEGGILIEGVYENSPIIYYYGLGLS